MSDGSATSSKAMVFRQWTEGLKTRVRLICWVYLRKQALQHVCFHSLLILNSEFVDALIKFKDE